MGDADVIRIVVADDHHMTLAGLALSLDTVDDFEVVGQASDGEAALVQVWTMSPDVLVVDVEMPRLSGVEVARTISSGAGDVRILALSAYDQPEYVYGLLDAGASGYLMKEEADRDMLITAIREIMRGDDLWISPELATSLVRSQVSGHRERLEALSQREYEVLRLVASGLDNQQISDTLFISPHTVKNHLEHVKGKLVVRTRAEVIAWAWHNRVLKPGSKP
ncbi:MAG: response regulator transcription factor [Rhodothermales bacterium]|nr:response regulator transcription factor [Rhodothermales bacterium]